MEMTGVDVGRLNAAGRSESSLASVLGRFLNNQLRFVPASRFTKSVIDSDELLADWLPRVRAADWLALDTEADSLHAYPEKLCLIQISLPGADELIDPL